MQKTVHLLSIIAAAMFLFSSCNKVTPDNNTNNQKDEESKEMELTETVWSANFNNLSWTLSFAAPTATKPVILEWKSSKEVHDTYGWYSIKDNIVTFKELEMFEVHSVGSDAENIKYRFLEAIVEDATMKSKVKIWTAYSTSGSPTIKDGEYEIVFSKQ